MEKFGESALIVLNILDFDPYYGKRVSDEVQECVDNEDREIVFERIYDREPGRYYDEVLVRAREPGALAKKIGKEDEKTQLESVAAELESMNGNYDGLPEFTTPSLVVVVTMSGDIGSDIEFDAI